MALRPIELIIKARDEASTVLGSIQGKAKALLAAFGAYVGVNAFAGMVQGAAELEAKLSEVQAVSGASAAELQALRQAAEDAGATTKFSATEAAGALGELARSGLSSQQSIGALKATLDLATAGGYSLEESAATVSKALNVFGIAAADAGRVADVLAQGANASNTSVKGLADALSYAGPVAKAVGLDLETTVAIIGKFSDAGIDASRAGTALNAILSQFADPASKFSSELAAIGITTRDFSKALVQLAASGKEGEAAIIAVGTEAGPALRGLLNQGIPSLLDLKAKLDGAAGSAKATADVMTNNLSGSVSNLSSAWDTFKNALATPILPVIRDGVDRLTTSIKAAVDSGLVTRFGTSLAKGFEAALEWVQRFLGQVNFEQIATNIGNAADRVSTYFDDLRAKANTAGAVFDTVFGTLKAGFSGILTVVYSFGQAFATVNQGILQGLGWIAEKVSAITFGDVSRRFAQLAQDVRTEAGAAGAVAEAMGQKSRQAFIAMAEGAQTARDGFARLTAGQQAAAVQGQQTNGVIATTVQQLQAMGTAATAAGSQAAQAAAQQAQAAQDAQAKVEALRTQYEQAVQGGQWQQAADTLAQLKQAAEAARGAISGMSDDAKAKADQVAAAFRLMGISTKDELTKSAESARQNFQLIKDSGQATAEGVREAWVKYANAAIAANGGVATEVIKAQAGMYKLKVTTDEFGRSVVTSMDGGTASTARFHAAVRGATQSLAEQNDQLERQITQQERANALKERANALERQRLNIDKEGFSLNTNGQRIQQTVETENSLFQQLTSGGMDAATANRMAKELFAKYQVWAQGTTSPVGGGLLGSGASAGAAPEWLTQPFQNLINAELQRYKVRQASTPAAAATASPASTTAKTYNVTLNGRTVRTASDVDARALLDMIEQARRAA